MANLYFTLALLRNGSSVLRSKHHSTGHGLTSSDTLKIRTTSALFALKTVTDLMGCSSASSLMMDAIVQLDSLRTWAKQHLTPRRMMAVQNTSQDTYPRRGTNFGAESIRNPMSHP